MSFADKFNFTDSHLYDRSGVAVQNEWVCIIGIDNMNDYTESVSAQQNLKIFHVRF